MKESCLFLHILDVKLQISVPIKKTDTWQGTFIYPVYGEKVGSGFDCLRNGLQRDEQTVINSCDSSLLK